MALRTTSFGWILGTQDGQRLAQCNGPGFGPTTSHRAECWGKLSIARFLHHLQQFSSTPYPPHLRVISMADNNGLVTSLVKRGEYATPYPNATLQPDWDLIEEIHTTYQQINIAKVRFQWIKGHQDKDTPYDELSIPAQYNVDAGRLATEFLETNLDIRRISPLVPSAKCLLHIRNASIHSHYTKQIREAASIHDLFDYLRRKYDWSKQIIKTIQWDWFQLAANNYSHTDNHLTKLVYDQLPTQVYKSKQGGQKWLSPSCRLCNQELETFDHLLRCTHSISQGFRSALPLKVSSYCRKKNSPHNFHATIVIALENWVRDQAPLESTLSSPAVHKLIHSQRQIGWTHFLRGFLSKQWQDYLEYELHHNEEAPAPPHFDYDQFFCGLIKVMWEAQSNFWMEFHKHLRQHQSESQIPTNVEEYKTEIRYLYSLRGHTLPQHRDDYFPQRLSEFLEHSSPSQLQTYITNYKPAIRQSIKDAQKRSMNSKRIYQFLGFTRRQHSRPRPPSALTTPLDPPSNEHHRFTTNPTNPNLRRRTLTQTRLTKPDATNNVTSYIRERPPHKHSRWKSPGPTQLRIHAFFATTHPTLTTEKEKSN